MSDSTDDPEWRHHPQSLRLFKHLSAFAMTVGAIENLHKPTDNGKHCTHCSGIFKRVSYPCKTITEVRKIST